MSKLPEYLKAVKENYLETENMKFDNFSAFAKFILMGNEKGPDLIQLELSGIKNGKKGWIKISAKNMVEVIEKYNKAFDTPMTQSMVTRLLDNVMTGMVKAVKQSEGKISHISVGDQNEPPKQIQ